MIVQSYKKENYKEDQNIVIYGAGSYGEIVFHCLKKWGITACCFADRNTLMKQKCGLPVISPLEIKKVDHAVVLVASANYLQEMAGFLVENQILNFYDVSLLIKTDIDDEKMSEYARDAKRNVERYQFSLDNISSKKFVMKNMDLVVTEYCNLRCKDCGSLIPYYKTPRHVGLDEIVIPLNNFLKTIDELYALQILGGEPFMYPYLVDLLERYGEHEKIKIIEIFTNSTIIPKDSVFQSMKKNNVALHMSNYGKHSKKVKELEEKCVEFNLKYHIHEYSEWRDMGTTELRNYDADEVKKIFKWCENAKCPSFYRGRLFVCPRAAHGESIGAFKNYEGEYVDFRGTIDVSEKVLELDNLLNKKEWVNACHYCSGNNQHAKPIKAALQL